MKEIWKEYKDPYWISNLGNIKNIKTGNYLKGYIQNNGYQIVRLRSIDEFELVHRLVAKLFADNDNPIEKTQVNHIDGNKENNCISNLEWVSPKENMHHSFNTGLQAKEMKRIYCFTLEGEYVGDFVNAVEAARFIGEDLAAHSTIAKTVKASHIAYDLWWTYSSEFDRKRKIEVYDKETKVLVASYYNQKECCEDLNISTSHLSQCLKGTKNHSKYIFTKIE